MNLSIFNTANLFEAGTNLFQQLGIKLNSNTVKEIPLKDLLKSYFKDNETFNAVRTTYFIGIIDDSVFRATGMFDVNYSINDALQQGDKSYEGLMLFALELTKKPTRTEISEITRAFNRISQKMPVALVLKYTIDNEVVISIAISERFKYLQNWRQGEKTGKIIILRDIFTTHTHAGHQRILLDLVKPTGVTNYAQLHEQWLEVLDVNILNKKFFQELANWYFWAMDRVQFPDDIEKKKDLRNATNLIRLITRVIFIWFVKEKHLVPASLFNEAYLNKILKDFNINQNESNYYQAILQNLFFGTLNQKMDERDFAEDHNRTNKLDQGIKNKYRYPEKFKISKREVNELFKEIPFLNGGLFDCLDKFDEEKLEKGKKEQKFVDGFTRLEEKQAIVPDYLFFGEEREVDLTEYYDPEAKKPIIKKVKGLIDILNHFKFTVAENTPIEEEIALDPELLGKVFENLLANYNPETKTTARKQTGSFYTPREIVNYMVDESLIENLKQNTNIQSDDFDTRLRNLFSYNDEIDPFNSKETDELIEAINNSKILDPACGSGAFPMGVLHKMVHILRKLDPGNVKWKIQQREKIIGSQIKELEKDKEAIAGLSDKAVREKAIIAVEERLIEVEEIFESKNNFDDYARKLYLIENCIYGIDIQPIAVQISKLRFFISLIIDQDKDNKKENLGFRSLPNLETKFVAANTLVGLEIPTTDLFSENNPIKLLQEQLKATRHEYFNAKTRKDKLQLQQQDKELRRKIAAQISDTLIHKKEDEITQLEKRLADAKKSLKHTEAGPELKETIEITNLFGQTETTVTDKKKEKIKDQKSTINLIEKQISTLKATDNKEAIQKVAGQISSFDPYDQNHFANWFEPEWMFGNDVKDGFDIVIGNPPYIDIKALPKDDVKLYFKIFKTTENRINLYAIFIEKGISILNSSGILAYINPNSILINESYTKIRKHILSGVEKIIKLPDSVFESVTVETIIIFSKKESSNSNILGVYFANNDKIDFSNLVFNSFSRDEWKSDEDSRFNIFGNTKGTEILRKIQNKSIKLENYVKISLGITPYDKYKGHSDELIQNREFHSLEKLSKQYVPLISGKNIHPYFISDEIEEYLKYGDWLGAPREKTFFENPKIIVRQIVGGKELKIVAGYSESPRYFTQIGFSLISKNNDNDNLKFILSLLNSNILNYYHKNKFLDTEKVVFQKILIANCKQLPIKEQNNISPFVKIVDFITNLKEANNDSSFFERLIDAMVYELYLPDEIKAGGAEVLKYLANLPELTVGQNEQNLKTIEKVYKELSDPKHPISGALLKLLNIDEVNIIEGRV
jgi:hypothetical protein